MKWEKIPFCSPGPTVTKKVHFANWHWFLRRECVVSNYICHKWASQTWHLLSQLSTATVNVHKKDCFLTAKARTPKLEKIHLVIKNLKNWLFLSFPEKRRRHSWKLLRWFFFGFVVRNDHAANTETIGTYDLCTVQSKNVIGFSTNLIPVSTDLMAKVVLMWSERCQSMD